MKLKVFEEVRRTKDAPLNRMANFNNNKITDDSNLNQGNNKFREESHEHLSFLNESLNDSVELMSDRGPNSPSFLEDLNDHERKLLNLNESARRSCHNLTLSSESDLSMSLIDHEIDRCMNSTDIDELPVFDLRMISPHGRTPSPITTSTDDNDGPSSARKAALKKQTAYLLTTACLNNPDYIALKDINAQISPPSEHIDLLHDPSRLNSNQQPPIQSTCSSNEFIHHNSSTLETIFEGVFLNTPPRNGLAVNNCNNRQSSVEVKGQEVNVNSITGFSGYKKQRRNLMFDKIVLNRGHQNVGDKENFSPVDFNNERTSSLMSTSLTSSTLSPRTLEVQSETILGNNIASSSLTQLPKINENHIV